MARQNGILPLEGTIGNITFFKSKDGYLARSKGGVDGDKIRTSSTFQRTRENNAEFGSAGKAGKTLRTAFRSMMQTCPDSRVVSRLAAEILKAIKKDGTSKRGERNIIDGEVNGLEGFEFNVNSKLSSSFFAPYTATIDRVAGTLKVEIPPFIAADMVVAPPGATHYRLVTLGAAIDFEGDTYENDMQTTKHLAFDNSVTTPITLTNSVSPDSTHPLFLAMNIEFTQFLNGEAYSLKTAHLMRCPLSKCWDRNY